MPKWNEYKAEAQSRGSLALEMYVVHSTPVKPMDVVKSVLPDHLAYQQAQESKGKLAFAGPLSDETGELMEGVGLIVYRASSLDEAKSIAENDPMHSAGARNFTIKKWLINEGSLSLSVGLSTQKVELQ